MENKERFILTANPNTMAEINAPVARKKKAGVPALKKKLLRIDLTPMVDLGFLLITFFMFATTLAEPKALKLTTPVNKVDCGIPVAKEKGLVLILGKYNLIYSYEAADPMNTFHISSFEQISRFRELVAAKKRKALAEIPNDPKLVISLKCTEDATYGNFVDMLDEMQITKAGITIVDAVNDFEKGMIERTGE